MERAARKVVSIPLIEYPAPSNVPSNEFDTFPSPAIETSFPEKSISAPSLTVFPEYDSPEVTELANELNSSAVVIIISPACTGLSSVPLI